MKAEDFLFKRFQPKKKLELINGMTETELLSISDKTVTRIIKEAGTNRYKSRDKELRLDREFITGNSWNSSIDCWDLYKGKAYVNFYIQYNNTDTENSDTFQNFIRRGEYRGALTRTDRYDCPQTHYYIYDEEDKAKAIRSLLNQYIHNKYNSKLQADGNS